MHPSHHTRRVLMVCLGNICRSPTAEAVLRHRLQRAGMACDVQVDSAGTHAWHVDKAPDARATAHAARRGYDLTALKARRVVAADFDEFDLILAMDDANMQALRDAGPVHHHGKLRRLMEFATTATSAVVPDPYYGGAAGFERVLDLVELGCDGLVQYLQTLHGRSGETRSPLPARL